MNYGFNDFIALLFITWLLIFLLHEAVGGLTALFYKHFGESDSLKITWKK